MKKSVDQTGDNTSKAAANTELEAGKEDSNLFQFVDNRPNKSFQLKDKKGDRFQDNREVKTDNSFTKGSSNKNKANHLNVVQGEFTDDAIDTLRGEGADKEEQLGISGCGGTARHVYNTLAPEKIEVSSGEGLESLSVAIKDAASRPNTQILYKVAAEDIGHQFTILQKENQAVIIQSYVGLMTLDQHLNSIQGEGTKNANTLADQLATLWRNLNSFKASQSEDDKAGFIASHIAVVGVAGDHNFWLNLTRRIVSFPPGGYLGKGSPWGAKFIEGDDSPLNTDVPRRRRGKRKCYLTTACTKARGLDDDCYELRILRRFRDEYMMTTSDGPELIKKYYEIAPQIVDNIEAHPESIALFDNIYKNILISVKMIESGELEAALKNYKRLVEDLAEKYY